LEAYDPAFYSTFVFNKILASVAKEIPLALLLPTGNELNLFRISGLDFWRIIGKIR
jgi:hypothetical protein